MTEKELIKKLNSLKSIKLDSNFKEESGRVLYNQISNSSGGFTASLNVFQKAFGYIAQPMWAVFFVVVVIGGGIFGVQASNYSNPGDSLYIAKIISNKAKLAITFDEEKKTKMRIRFASDHAKDITKFLAESDPKEETKETEKLSKNFKEQIYSVKTKLKEIKIAKNDENEEGGEMVEESIPDDEAVFGANLGKEEKGVQISIPDDPISDSPQNDEGQTAENEEGEAGGEEISILNNNNEENATGTEAIEEIIEESNNSNNDLEKAEEILSEAESLFDSKNYNGALNKLDEAGVIINSVTGEEDGEVKGESEAASSTEKTQN
jgi:hypothetical protein